MKIGGQSELSAIIMAFEEGDSSILKDLEAFPDGNGSTVESE